MANFLFRVSLDFEWPIGELWKGYSCPYTCRKCEHCNSATVSGSCEFCNGEGYIWESDEIKKLHYAWRPSHPPSGEGFQAWEIEVFDDRGELYEGYPESPVFSTLKELCEWCVVNKITHMDALLSKAQWSGIFSGKPFNCEF
ncbi:hypothetical protein HDF26_003191 [Pedobacter cryoconitis]|uniref:hypothetical protein n=1 Tax=Pedobacter cryoconitis TaxID=188932 RepID=UPI00160D35F6|nr:hypothetical protein [Pedobacter cryoconitis]MBB6272734.1 hypothetical protein [Pedobacter cryoconitis]